MTGRTVSRALERRSALLKVALPFRVRAHVPPVGVEKLLLDALLSGAIQKCRHVHPRIRIIALGMRRRTYMTLPSGVERQQVRPELVYIGGSVDPIGATRFPQRPPTPPHA